MLRNKELCSRYDLSPVREIHSGAAVLGAETSSELLKQYPNWVIRNVYGKFRPTGIVDSRSRDARLRCDNSSYAGLTETSSGVSATAFDDVWLGSSGCFIPGVEARLVSPDGKEITEYNTPGELVVRSPSVVLGYLDDEKATNETFKDGWVYTGDEVMIRLSPKNTEHVFIVDRIKELIKVKVSISTTKTICTF
jgi:acyl-CoA synthetase (AMP-forming)/AMP-acid ligase II